MAAHYLKTELYGLIRKDDQVFDFIQEASLDGLWYWDLEKPENEWMNTRFWEVLGYDPKEMPHKASAWQDIINPDDLKVALDNFHKHVADSNHPYDQEVRYTHKNGSIVWVRCRGLVIRDKDGKPVRMVGAHQNITNLKNTQAKLQHEHKQTKKQEELYRFLTENTADVIRHQSPDGAFSYVSPSIKDLTGYTPEEYLKFGSLENVVPEDHEILKQVVGKFAQGEDSIIVEYRLFHKSGKILWVESRIKAIRNEKGDAISLLSSTNNITARKEAEQQLKQSEQKYRLLAKETADNLSNLKAATNITIIFLDTNLEVFQFSPGAHASEHISKDEKTTLTNIAKQYRVTKLRDDCNKVLESHKAIEKEVICSHNLVWWMRISPYKTLEGNIEGLIITFTDITEKQQLDSEVKLLSDALENSMDAYDIVDEHGKFVYVNKSYLQMWGYDNAEEVIGTSPETHCANPEIPAEIIKQVMQYGKAEMEFKALRKDGSTFDVLMSVTRFVDNNDRTYFPTFSKDITEKKKQEAELEQHRNQLEELVEQKNQELVRSNTRYKQLVETAVDAIYLIDENGIVVDTNHQATLMLEKSRDEIIGQNVEVIDPNFSVDAFLAFWAPIPYDETRIFETTHIDKAGRVVPIEISGKKYKLDGKTYYYGIARDISERKLSEIKILENEAKLKSYFTNAPDGIFIADEKGKYLEVNPAACRITGYSNEELLQLSIPEILQKGELEKGLQHFKNVQEKGISNEEIGFVTKNGENRFWQVAAVKLSDTRFLGFVKDSTEQRLAEQKTQDSLNLLNSFINNFPDDAWIKDSEGHLTMVNQHAIEKTFGQGDFIGKTAHDIFPEELADQLWASEKEVLQSKATKQVEEQIPMLDGRIHSKVLTKFPIQNAEGEIIGLGGIAHDITEKKKAEIALIESEERYRSLSETTSSIIWTADAEGGFAVPQSSWEKYTGQAWSEHQGFGWSKKIHPEDIDSLLNVWNEACKNRSLYETSGRVWNAQLEDWRNFEVKAVPIINKDGSLREWVGFINDVTEQKEAEQKLADSEADVRRKLNAIAEPDGDLGILKLTDIVDVETMQPLVESLYRITGMCCGITDLEGNILASVGWTDACSLFHRKCPESEKNCIESDTILSTGIAAGAYKLYKCKNHLWESAAPLTISGQHMGNIYLGQFLYDDEEIDVNLYRKQAIKFGFNEKEYLDAIDRVPRFSKERVESAIHFFAEFAEMISKQSYNNIRLSRVLSQVRFAEQEIKASEARLAASQQMAKLGNFEYDFEKDNLWWSDELYAILGFEKAEIPPNHETFLKSMHPEDVANHRELVEKSYKFGEGYTTTFRYILPNDLEKHIYVRTEVIFDNDNKPKGLRGTAQDVTQRILAENEIRNQKDLFEMVINSVPSFIFWKDKDLNYLGCNTTFAKFAKLDKPSDIIGKSDYEMIWGAEAEKYRIDDRQVVDTSIEKCNYEESVLDHNGNHRLLHTNKMPLKNSAGKTIGTIATCEDITERKEAEEKIKQSEKRYKKVSELSSDYSYSHAYDENGNITLEWSFGAFEQITGYTPEESVSLEVLSKLFHPDDKDELGKRLEQILKGKTVVSEVRIITKKGETKWIKDKGVPEWDDEKKRVIRCVGTAQEITQQKNVGIALRQSEAKFRGVFEDSNVGIALGSKEGTVLEVNDEYLRITGYSRMEFINLNFTDITHPDDLAKEMPLFKQFHSGEIDKYRIEKRLQAKNGHYVWLDSAISCRRDANGNVDLTIALVVDITETKRANEVVNVFFEQPMNIHLIGTIEGEITKINEGWITTLGYSKEETLGKNLKDFIHPDDKESTLNELNDLESGKTTFYFENRCKHKNGNYIDLAWSAIYNTSGKMLHGVAKDITSQKVYRKQLIKSEERYRELVNTVNSGIAIYKVLNDGLSGSDYIIQEFNQFALEHEKLAKKEVIGKSLKDIRPTIDDYGLIDVFREVWKTGKPAFFPAKVYIDEKYSNYYENRIFRIPSGEIVAVYDDVSEREIAQLKLSESYDRFDKAMEATTDGLWDWNLTNNEIYYSPRWKAMLGYKENELSNDFSVWEELTDPEDVKSAWETLNALIEGKKEKFDIEFRMKHKNGHWVDIHSRANVFNNEEGEAIRVVGTHTDITLKKKAEDEIRQLNTRFDLATDAANIGVWDLDLVNNQLSWDDRMFKLYGLEKNAFGGAYESWQNGVHPDDLQQADDEVQQAIRGEKEFDTEFRVVWPNKEVRHLRAYAQVVFNDSGKAIRMTGVNFDITESKQAEEKIRDREKKLRLSDVRYRKAEEIGRVGNWEYNIQTTEFWASDNSKRIYGFDLEQKSFSTEKVESCIPEREWVHQAMVDLIESEVPFNLEFDIVTNDTGERKTISSKAELIKDEHGNPLNVVGIIQDVSERLQFEKALKLAKEKAEESNRLKSEFLHNMSHEIRTPMNGIMGFSGLLSDNETTDEERKYYTTIIQNSSNQLLRIIDDILEISVLETKQQRIFEESFLLNDFLMELFSIFDIKGKERNIPIYLKKGLTDEKSEIKTDKAKLNKVLSNLLENALKFTNQGYIELGYKLEKSNVIIYVKDTGMGISPEHKGRIFKRFSQESKDIAQSYGGLGLGLSIAKENTELLGGSISFESEKGKGATFFVSIPYKTNKRLAAEKENQNMVAVAESKKMECEILVAEDEENNFLYIETVLKSHKDINCRIIHAKNGQEAVDLCRNNPEIQLVLMDIKMPIMSGYDATKKIKAIFPDLPVIAQTAFSTQADRDLAFKNGCDDFISKPIDKERLLQLVNKHLK